MEVKNDTNRTLWNAQISKSFLKKRKKQPSDFTYMISSVRTKVRNVPFPKIQSPIENPVLITYTLWHILPIGSTPSATKESVSQHGARIINDREFSYFLTPPFKHSE